LDLEFSNYKVRTFLFNKTGFIRWKHKSPHVCQAFAVPKSPSLFAEITWKSSEMELPSAMVRFVQGVVMGLEDDVGWPYRNSFTQK